MHLKNCFILLSLFIFHFLQAQVKNASILPTGCGADKYLLDLRKNNSFSTNERILNEQIRSFNAIKQSSVQNNQMSKNSKSTNSGAFIKNQVINSVIFIPVVVHILNLNPDAITDQMVKDGIVELNKAFAHQGAYGVDTLGVNTGIQFCLANTAPDGSLTNGIDRIKTYYETVDQDLEGAMLPKLTQWDLSQYANIWLVSKINGEIQPSVFECGQWSRSGVGGYASAGGGLVVSSLNGPLVAHEMGHYLSLLHTFQGMNCANADCTLDGDLVCDTPPDRSVKSSPCNSPENSCSTDTLSGPFTKDVPDNISNFMDYGSPCPTVFTNGQADRMIAFLNLFSGGSLMKSTRCNAPCSDNVAANFDWYANPYPKAGDVLAFNNTSTGSIDFEWFVNGVKSAVTKNFSYPVSTVGTYIIKLLAYSAGRKCVSSYSGNVIVNCGVDARFSPDKRIIAASVAAYKDPVLFQNSSVGADTYNWLVSDSTGNNFSIVSNSKDLLYNFLKSGLYNIKLEASKGICLATSSTFSLTVLNPKSDGSLTINQINCYKEDSLRIVFTITNNGYDTIPAGTTVSFYDQFPVQANQQKLSPSFVMDKDLLGLCSVTYSYIVKASSPKQDSLLLVFDESNLIDEMNESNNKTSGQKFQFRPKVIPSDTLVYVNSNISLLLQKNANDNIASVLWSPGSNLSCTSCVNPTLQTTDTVLLKAVAKSSFDCTDTAYAYIKVIPIDLSAENLSAVCYKNDSMQVQTKLCLTNNYLNLKKKIEIEYFDADISSGFSNKLGSVFIDQNTVFPDSPGCTTISTTIKLTKTNKLYVYINRTLEQFETNITNNVSVVDYNPFKLVIDPAEYEIFREQTIMLTVVNKGESYSNLQWTPADEALSCSNCLVAFVKTKINRTYKIWGSTANFCTDSTSVLVKAFYQSHIALPNIFTPNGDGNNDWFYVIAGKEVTMVKQFQVFNRWGEKIFDKQNTLPNDRSAGWNGYYKGKVAENGTYVYYIVLGLQDGNIEEKRGNITLLR